MQTLENRQGLKIGCPEEIAYLKGWIGAQDVRALAAPFLKTEYGRYLIRLIAE